MTSNILEHVSKPSSFAPLIPEHLLALKIANRLQDLENLRRYLVLSEHYPKELLLKAYQKALGAPERSSVFFAFFTT